MRSNDCNYDQVHHPYSDQFPVEYFIDMCTDIFGPKFSRAMIEDAMAATNVEYGGQWLAVTNVVFVQGSIDPWHAETS